MSGSDVIDVHVLSGGAADLVSAAAEPQRVVIYTMKSHMYIDSDIHPR